MSRPFSQIVMILFYKSSLQIASIKNVSGSMWSREAILGGGLMVMNGSYWVLLIINSIFMISLDLIKDRKYHVN